MRWQMTEHALTDGTAFGLGPGHLGRNRFGEISLHARVSATLDRICRDVPGCVVDVLDDDGDRLRLPAPVGAFVEPVEMFDIPRAAPHWLVVYGRDAAAPFGDAFPDMVGRPYAGFSDGIAFELGREHLGRDRFGLIHLGDDLRRAIDGIFKDAGYKHVGFGDAGRSQWKVFDGEGLPVKPSRPGVGEPVAGFAAEPVSVFNGFEPRYVVIHDRRAAERFGQLFPKMRRDRLADLERLWREARKP